MLIETPGLLIGGEEPEYIGKFKQIFEENNEINIPEIPDKKVIVHTKSGSSDKNILHIWRGSKNYNFDNPETWRRAQRILRIKYIIENPSTRIIYEDKKEGTLVFGSTELEYSVVLRESSKFFYLVTSFHTYNAYRYFTSDRFTKWEKSN